MAQAIAKIQFQWDTDKVRYRTSGSGLMKDIESFWAAHGLVAEVVDVIGLTGERVIVLSEMELQQIDKKNLMVEKQVGIQQKLAQMQKGPKK